jgi:hypothetical protein
LLILRYNTNVESIKRCVKDINVADRRALEHVIGQHLSENQQVVIQVLDVDVANRDIPSNPQGIEPPTLPPWCNIYEGLSDADIDDLDSSIVRSHDSHYFR